MSFTVGQALKHMVEVFTVAGIPSPHVDAEFLLEHVTGLSRVRQLMDRHVFLEHEEWNRLQDYMQRRANREPLQLLLGYTYFYGLRLKVREGVLIPRPETETLVSLVLERNMKMRPRVLDIGTGTGAIALALLHEIPFADVTATDINPVCVQLARENAKALDLQLQVAQGDLFAGLDGFFEIVVSNPPYLPEEDEASEMPELKYESNIALYSGSDGLGLARRIVRESVLHLKSGGILALELDPRNVRILEAELDRKSWAVSEVYQDLTGQERFLVAMKR
ncbi:peptide chain release factor N(5)-glutamine methyltransferase [Deinococcus cellulosilyticus]|uniref:Release factor glutamine methyltransferase n=1 Tax=Deinococcus cellulosilyticus (strain DSM 18568 / NBRC 106333 / KACC 11606 / 5516J-15) TaxID=1223518 RepID=A0A511N5M6_DEIC1|nr:peptide chain release factor N(5)-glutamine methyltransferase [Deinococcus cellulosilyticus]GEM48170.1 release factor glutamine methyltransferase [Deinococcus cellulosilyticus NBRC 106333 = KACC 11606]